MKSNRILLLGFFVLAAILLTVNLFLTNAPVEKDRKAEYIKGGEFSLPSTLGKDFSLSDARGRPAVLYFGFTHCPDICPVGLAVIRDALKIDPDFSEVMPVFATLDPARDTIDRLKEYLAFFDPSLVGLSGSDEQIASLAKQYSTYFKALEPDENGNYNVDHTAYFYVIDREGELVRVLDHDTDAEGLASVLKEFF